VLYNIDMTAYTILPTLNLKLKYRKYAQMFSAGERLMVQTRYRPERDSFDALWGAAKFDSETLHKQSSKNPNTLNYQLEYTKESYYSLLFHYNFENSFWEQLEFNGSYLPVCTSLINSKDNKRVYFLSSITQGYQFNAETLRLKPLHSIGRPQSLSAGSSLVLWDDKTLFAIGGARPYWEMKDFRTYPKLAKFFDHRRNVPQPKTKTKYYDDIVILDLAKNRWLKPTVKIPESFNLKNLSDCICLVRNEKIFLMNYKTGKSYELYVDPTPKPLPEPEEYEETNEEEENEENKNENKDVENKESEENKKSEENKGSEENKKSENPSDNKNKTK